jgi:hypothetical protein
VSGEASTDRGRTSRLLTAAAVLAVIVAVPLAVANPGGSAGTDKSATGLAKKVRKLQKQVRKLRQQVADISTQPGQPGATGPQGVQGPPGNDAQFAGAAASGDLTGTYPDPQIAGGAVAGPEILNFSINSADLNIGAVGSVQIADGGVGALEIGDQIVDRQDPTPTLIAGGTAENGSYNTDQSIANCATGEELIGGYATWTDVAGSNEELFVQRVGLDHTNENVIVVGGNDSGLDRHLMAVATCLQP